MKHVLNLLKEEAYINYYYQILVFSYWVFIALVFEDVSYARFFFSRRDRLFLLLVLGGGTSSYMAEGCG